MRCTRTFVVVLASTGTLLQPTSLLAQQPTMEGYPPPGAPPVITVTDLGSEPRVFLRFKVSPGQRTGMLMSVKMSLTTQLGGRTQTARIPAFTITGDVTVTGVSADGDISYSLGVTEMKFDASDGSDPGSLAALQNLAALFSKVTAAATVSSRGVLRDIRWNLDEIPDAQSRQQMSQSLESWADSMVPWPEDTVGVGARWSVRQTVLKHGMSLFMAADYQVVSIDGSGVTVMLTTKGTAPTQVVTATNGMSMSMTSSGSGKMTMRLDSLVPTSESRATMAMVMDQPDSPGSLRVTAESEIAITPTAPLPSRAAQPTPAGAGAGDTAQQPVRIGRSAKPRFDTALTGWDTAAVRPAHMRVRSGVLTLTGNSGWLLTSDRCENVSLRFEARALTPDTVAGVLFHALRVPPSAYELRLCQGGHCGQLLQHDHGETRPVHLGIVIRPAKKWRRYAVDVNGTAILALVDGERVVNKRGLVHNSGYVGFQAERGAIEVRKLELDCASLPPPASIDAVRPGGGVSSPIPLHQPKPQYTSEALRAKVEGEVWLEAVVLPDGTVGQVEVVRPLHPDLDAEAISAAKMWRFTPGTRDGEPVAVLITISMSFTLK